MSLMKPHGDFLESTRMEAMVKAMRAERELCIQDVDTFKKLREGIRARKRNCGSRQLKKVKVLLYPSPPLAHGRVQDRKSVV